jgi:1-deoxy-D-xylulose 5-phosphate reductoisomerase
VEQFLQRNINFIEIPRLITQVMEQISTGPADRLDSILQADASARELALSLVVSGVN